MLPLSLVTGLTGDALTGGGFPHLPRSVLLSSVLLFVFPVHLQLHGVVWCEGIYFPLRCVGFEICTGFGVPVLVHTANIFRCD